MDIVFLGATALLYLLTVALAAGCNQLGQTGQAGQAGKAGQSGQSGKAGGQP